MTSTFFRWIYCLNIPVLLLMLIAVSAAIEQIQYLFVLGQPDVDDIIHNTFGAAIGGAVGSFIVFRKSK